MISQCPAIRRLSEHGIHDRQRTLTAVEDALTHVGDTVGDISAQVMARFYAMHPEMRAAFERLSLGKPRGLEGEMVEQIVFSLMELLHHPSEVRIMLQTTVPHHEFLKVPTQCFNALIDCVVDVVLEELPQALKEDGEHLDRVRQCLKSLVTD